MNGRLRYVALFSDHEMRFTSMGVWENNWAMELAYELDCFFFFFCMTCCMHILGDRDGLEI